MPSRLDTTELLDESVPIVSVLSISLVFVAVSEFVVRDSDLAYADEIGMALTWIFGTTGLALVLLYVIARGVALATEEQAPATASQSRPDEP